MATRQGQAFIEYLDAELARCEQNLVTASEPFERGLWAGWRDCFREVRWRALNDLPAIEEEASLVPVVEEDYATMRERLLAEEGIAA